MSWALWMTSQQPLYPGKRPQRIYKPPPLLAVISPKEPNKPPHRARECSSVGSRLSTAQRTWHLLCILIGNKRSKRHRKSPLCVVMKRLLHAAIRCLEGMRVFGNVRFSLIICNKQQSTFSWLQLTINTHTAICQASIVGSKSLQSMLRVCKYLPVLFSH